MTTRGKFVIGFVIALLFTVGLTIFAFLIPATFRYEKQADIIAQQRMIFVFIGDLKRWSEWTKWAARDPSMDNEFSDPSWGVGARYSWKTWGFGNKSGSLTVTQFTAPDFMSYDLTPDGWETSKWQIRLVPAPRQGSTVTWTVEGQYPESRFWRLVAYFGMWNLASDMQQGLERLKKHAEQHEAYDVFGGWETPRKSSPGRGGF